MGIPAGKICGGDFLVSFVNHFYFMVDISFLLLYSHIVVRQNILQPFGRNEISMDKTEKEAR